MTPKTKAPRTLSAELGDALSPGEQAHIDSGGADALAEAPPGDVIADAGAAVGPGAEGTVSGASSDAGGVADAEAAPPSGAETKPRMVPHAALHEEREARKAAEKRAAMLEERTGLILEALRTGTLGGAQAAPQAQTAAPALPDYKADPQAHVLGRLERTDQAVTTLAQLLMGQQQETQQKGAAEGAWGRARMLEDQFRAQTPDHDAAMAHLKRTRHEILAAMGVSDAMQRERQIAFELQHIAQVAAHENQNPAEMLYTMAQATGYQRAGSTPSHAAPSGDAAARIAAAAAGQRQAGALGTVRGTGPVPLTAARLIEMSDAEFARAIATPEGRALLGA